MLRLCTRLTIARYYASTINPLKSRDLINHTRFAPLHIIVLHKQCWSVHVLAYYNVNNITPR
jgi:hypothetical protein